MGDRKGSAAERLCTAVETGLDELFFNQLAEFHGMTLTRDEVRRLRLKLPRRA